MAGEIVLEEKEGIYLFICLPTYLPMKFFHEKGTELNVQVKDKRVMSRSPVPLSVSWAMVLADPHLDTVASARHTWQV